MHIPLLEPSLLAESTMKRCQPMLPFMPDVARPLRATSGSKLPARLFEAGGLCSSKHLQYQLSLATPVHQS